MKSFCASFTDQVQWPILLSNSHAYPFCKTTSRYSVIWYWPLHFFCQWNLLKTVVKLFSQWKWQCTSTLIMLVQETHIPGIRPPIWLSPTNAIIGTSSSPRSVISCGSHVAFSTPWFNWSPDSKVIGTHSRTWSKYFECNFGFSKGQMPGTGSYFYIFHGCIVWPRADVISKC